MRVLFFWEDVGGLTLAHHCNPYAGLLALALARRGIHLELGDYAFTREWLRRNRDEFSVLHLNWLHQFYREDDRVKTQQRYDRFAANLPYARELGYRIVWTLHNLYPHERPFPDIDRAARLLVCEQADVVITHCRRAAQLAAEHFGRRERVEVVPHGHFIDVYPNEISRAEARARLHLDADRFVYLFFGNARTYKSVESLIAAFRRAAADDTVLILMLRSSFNPEYTAELERQAAGDDRVLVFTDPYFPEADFQIYLNSADAVVLPFAEVLTSGSAIAALSFGIPVILPRRGCLPELIDDSMGILFDPDDDGLERALAQIRLLDLEAAGAAAYRRAREFDWEDIAGRIARIYCAAEADNMMKEGSQ